MALIFTVIYPNGETAEAVGYPDQVLRVDVVPRGPEACLYDEVECEFLPDYRAKVRRIVAGPRRRTIHVRVTGNRDAWMDARDAEGWWTRGVPTWTTWCGSSPSIEIATPASWSRPAVSSWDRPRRPWGSDSQPRPVTRHDAVAVA